MEFELHLLSCMKPVFFLVTSVGLTRPLTQPPLWADFFALYTPKPNLWFLMTLLPKGGVYGVEWHTGIKQRHDWRHRRVFHMHSTLSSCCMSFWPLPQPPERSDFSGGKRWHRVFILIESLLPSRCLQVEPEIGSWYNKNNKQNNKWGALSQ